MLKFRRAGHRQYDGDDRTIVYSKIIVPLDGSAFSETALPYVRVIAARLGIPIELVEACDVLPPAVHHRQWTEVTRRMLYEVQRNSRNYLGQIQDGLKSTGLVVSATTLPGPPAQVLGDWLVREPEALVVMATHGRGGIARWALGSIADSVLHSTPNPVLLIRSGRSVAPSDGVDVKTVLAPLDGSELSEQSLPHAAAVATGLGARIMLLQVTGTRDFYRRYLDRAPAAGELIPIAEMVQADADDATASLVDASRRLAQEFGFVNEVEARHLPGHNPAEVIVEMAEAESSMVVMTTHGRSGLNRTVMGSVTDRVVRHANAPVLVVRRPGAPGAIGLGAPASEGFSAEFGNSATQPA